MMRPRKMKQIEITVLSRDVDSVIEYLGRKELMHFSSDNNDAGAGSSNKTPHIRENLNRLQSAAVYLGIELPKEPEEDTVLLQEEEESMAVTLTETIFELSAKENEQHGERKKLEETINEALAFSKLNAPFSDLEHLSYMTLRIGHLDPRRHEELRENLADRAVIIPLDDKGRVLAAASRKGRFALDSALKNTAFTPIAIPEGYKGVPSELLESLNGRLAAIDIELENINAKKQEIKKEQDTILKKLAASFLMAETVEEIKRRLRGTQNAFVISGWVPADDVKELVAELNRRTNGRTAIRSYNPEEVENVTEGREKVPVSLSHGAFVRGFEPVVLSYGSPLYGTLDPTPFVAFFFSILFGIMFGDVGQGMILLLFGFLFGSKNSKKSLASFRGYSVPLKAVGISSMIMGFLNGSFFTNEHILVKPTQTVLGFFMRILNIAGEPPERILNLVPEKGNIGKVLYFFGFTIAVGVILNSIGLVVNIANQFSLKRYEKAIFSKSGLAGILFFWYAIFMVVRIIQGGSFERYDYAGLAIPIFFIISGPAIWRLLAGERPVLEHGLGVFIVEGFVELLEVGSSYIANTVSFLRVGAFALSHAMLSFIVFTLSDMVHKLTAGPFFSILILFIGNAIIIILEGMIVAIQAVRLQYYEFFGKFFSDMGVAYAPFHFRNKTKP
ncbi:MAG: V-type ATP synthase subunit I [Treponema sp.]|nr:V-type ATP synthase subunit I [Treponema sp.]